MDVLPSSEFRKTFGKLTESTNVTANGHTIGTWIPAGVVAAVTADQGEEIAYLKRQLAQRAPVPVARSYPETERFNTKPFTPVPRERDKAKH
jgi:hypothetical protein